MIENLSSWRRKILLVEDQAMIALYEKTILEHDGYEVTIAANGERAVEIVETNPDIALVLMDIDLGNGIDGSEAAERILARHDVPIVFLSAHTESEIVKRTEGITSYGYIVKDSGEAVLLASVRMAFRLHKANRMVASQSRILATMLDVSMKLVSTLDLQTILQTSSDRLSELAGLDAGAIYLLHGDAIVLQTATPALPADSPGIFRRDNLSDHPHIALTLRTRAPIFVPESRTEEFTDAERTITEHRDLRSLLYIPLISRGNSVGVFIAGSLGHPATVPDPIINLCVTLANMAAVAVENAMFLARR